MFWVASLQNESLANIYIHILLTFSTRNDTFWYCQNMRGWERGRLRLSFQILQIIKYILLNDLNRSNECIEGLFLQIPRNILSKDSVIGIIYIDLQIKIYKIII